MAIKFVDVGPEGEDTEPKRARQAVAREPDAAALKESVEPELPHAEPAPKKRGRK